MKRILLTLFAICAFGLYTQAQTISLEGVYNGDNLVVMNPFGPTGVGFCVNEVTVNGQIATSEINSSTFEINFLEYDMDKGEGLEVVIRHKPGCQPRVVNKNVIKPRSTYKLVDIRINQEKEVLSWTTVSETGEIPFVVQQYRWNKWTNVASVMGEGVPEKQEYSVNVHIHSGENRFRIKQTDYTNEPNYSRELTFTSLKEKVEFDFRRFRGQILFSAPTKYEIFDAYGRKTISGFGKSIDVSNLDDGTYYVNYDDSMTSFNK